MAKTKNSKASVLSLTPIETYEFVTMCLACRKVPYVSGPPAIGKSQVIFSVAKDANAKVIDLRLSQMLSEDMTGLPERDEATGKAKYLPFDVFPLEGDPLPKGHDGWLLFLDELSSASEEVLAAAYSILLDHTVGGKKLHPKCLVVAAGNRASDSAIARELPDTLITRMMPCEMRCDHKSWIQWAENDCQNSNDFIISFLKKNPSMLYSPTKAEDREELETYPQPRGWEAMFAFMNLHEKRVAAKAAKKKSVPEDSSGIPIPQSASTGVQSEPIPDEIFNLFVSAIGHMAARSVREEYDEQIQLPYPWEIAQSPNSQRIPATHVGKASLTTQLSEYYLEADDSSRENVLSYMNRVGGEYRELFVSDIQSKLSSTQSDQRMIDTISKRLKVDPILGKASNSTTDDEDGENIPF